MIRTRRGALAVMLGLVTLLQAALVSSLGGLGSGADLVLPVVFIAAVVGGPAVGALAGLGAGLLLDVAPPAAHPIGQWGFVLGILGLVTGLTLHQRSTLPRLAAGAALVGALAPTLFVVLGLGLGDAHAHVSRLAGLVPGSAAWCLLLTALLYPLLRRTFGRTVSPDSFTLAVH